MQWIEGANKTRSVKKTLERSREDREGLEGGPQRLGVQELEHERQSERGRIIRLKAHDRRHLHGIKIRKSYRWLPSSSAPFYVHHRLDFELYPMD